MQIDRDKLHLGQIIMWVRTVRTLIGTKRVRVPAPFQKDNTDRRAIRSLSEAVNTTPFHGVGARFESGRDHHTGA